MHHTDTLYHCLTHLIAQTKHCRVEISILCTRQRARGTYKVAWLPPRRVAHQD